MQFRRLVQLYFRFFSTNLRTMLEYKIDFYIMCITGVFTEILGLVFVWALFQNIPSINGWSLWEVVFLYSMIYLSSGFVSFFFEGTWKLGLLVNKGELDRLLLRPVSPIFQVISFSIGPNGLSSLLLGCLMLFISLNNLHITWSFFKIIFFVIILVSVLVIRLAINIAASASSFWTKSGSNAIPMLIQNLSDFSRYPLSIFGIGIQILTVILIPLAFIGYFPAAFLFNTNEWWVALLTPFVSLYCAFTSIWLFNKGLEIYESTGN